VVDVCNKKQTFLEYNICMTEMNDNQTRAFNIYMDSATMDNGFIPISFKSIAEQLNLSFVEGSKSSVGRWSLKWKWKEMLEAKVSASLVEEGEAKDLIEQSSISAATQKVIDDFQTNERLKSNSYQILEAQMQKYFEKLKSGNYLTHDDEKFMLKVLEITSTREDKLLDRQAILDASKLVSSTELLRSLEILEVEIEEPIEAIELDIEE